MTLFLWQPLIATDTEVYLEKIKKLKDILYKSSISSNTANYYGFLESVNFLINLKKFEKVNYLTKNNIKINNPALIISSGPSLKDSVNLIKMSFLM